METNKWLSMMGRLISSDPETIGQEIDVCGLETKAHEFLKLMLSIHRRQKTRLRSVKKEGLIGGPVHLGVGQEACCCGCRCWAAFN